MSKRKNRPAGRWLLPKSTTTAQYIHYLYDGMHRREENALRLDNKQLALAEQMRADCDRIIAKRLTDRDNDARILEETRVRIEEAVEKILCPSHEVARLKHGPLPDTKANGKMVRRSDAPQDRN